VICGLNSARGAEEAGGAIVGLGVGVEALERQAREVNERIRSKERALFIVYSSYGIQSCCVEGAG
jgi:predicted ATP-grasp superfamily ATP-dependent carboligase